MTILFNHIKTKFYLLTLLFISTQLAFAQDPILEIYLTQADSLLSQNRDSLAYEKLEVAQDLLNKGDELQTARFFNYSGDCFMQLYQYRNSANAYLNLWDNTSKDSTTIQITARAINDLGIVFYRLGVIDSAILSHQKSLILYNQIKDYQGQAFNYNNLAIIYSDLKKTDSALIFQQKGIKAAEMAEDTLGIGFGKLNMGLTYVNSLSNYVDGVNLMLQALRVFEKAQKTQMVNSVKSKLSQVYIDIKDYPPALAILFELQELYSKGNNEKNKGRVSLNLSEVYLGLSQPDSALFFVDKAIAHYKKQEEPRWLPLAVHQKGKIFLQQGDLDQALSFFQKSLKLNGGKYLSDRNQIVSDIIKLFIQREEYTKAYELAKFILKDGEEKIQPILRADIFQAIYLREKQKGNLANALTYFEKAQALKDSIFNNQNSVEVARLEYLYELEKEESLFELEKQNLQAQSEQKIRQRNWLLFISGLGVIILIFAIAVLFRFYAIKNEANEELQELNNEISKKSEEILSQSEEISIQNKVLKAQKEELVSSYEKIVELDHFKEIMSGMIVHDLKNPLNVIIGKSDGNPTKSDLELIRRSGFRMLKLVSNILDIYKFKSSKMELLLSAIPLKQLVFDALEQVSVLAEEKEIQINYSIADELHVKVDQELLIRVFTNLFSNAIKYNPPLGLLNTQTKIIENGMLEITVSDTGEGIPEDKLEMVFELFGQAKAKDAGAARSTGIGLTFCRMVIEEHGGKISVVSKLNEGTTFTFTLPAIIKENKDKQQPTTENGSQTYAISKPQPLELSSSDKETLRGVLPQLQELEVYFFSEIKEVINKIDFSQSAGLQKWKSELEEAISQINEQQYARLIGNT